MTPLVHRIRAGDVELAALEWPGGNVSETEGETEGESVCLLHGFTGCARSLEGLARALAPRRVLAIDLLGHGESDAPEDPACYALERCAAQVARVIASCFDTPPHLFGYSLGARVALGVGVFEPGAVRSLALLGGRAGIQDAEERAQRRCDDDALAARIEAEGVASFVDYWESIPLFASQLRRLPAAARAAQREGRLANRARGLAGSLRGLGAGAQPPLHTELERVSLPVWLGHGEEDTKFAALAAGLAAALPRAELYAIPAAGHAAHLENPEATVLALQDFFARIEARDRSPEMHDAFVEKRAAGFERFPWRP